MSLSERLRTLRSYLDGSGDLEGVFFGEEPEEDQPPYWWRKHLTAMDEAATTIDTQAAEIERLRASLAEAVGVLRPFAEIAKMGGASSNMPRAFHAARDFITKHGGGS